MAFTERELRAGLKVSMDGRGRVMDTLFVEGLWRSEVSMDGRGRVMDTLFVEGL